MSRKTAVCVLFVFFLAIAGTTGSVQAASWTADCASGFSPSQGPRAATAPQTNTIDPDGLTAPAPSFTSGWVRYWIRTLLDSFLL